MSNVKNDPKYKNGLLQAIRGLLEHCVPLMTNQYWFFKYYVLLLLIAPFLNQLIVALDQKQHERIG